jgi:hypothetical protein
MSEAFDPPEPFEPPCRDLIKNVSTNRCVKLTGRVGRRLTEQIPCIGYTLNPKTKRCNRPARAKGVRTSKAASNVLFTDAVLKAFNTAVKGQVFSKSTSKNVPIEYFLDRVKCRNKIDLYNRELDLTHYIEDSLEIAYGQQSGIVDFIYTKDSHGDICAILFAEKNECTELPNIWTVRLLCGKQKNNPVPECSKKSVFLIGMYCYALKHCGQTLGLLELAGNYRNLEAYCLYDKFGFTESAQLCSAFDYNSMTADMTVLTPADIIEIVRTNKKRGQPKLLCRPQVKINAALQKTIVKLLSKKKKSAKDMTLLSDYQDQYA